MFYNSLELFVFGKVIGISNVWNMVGNDVYVFIIKKGIYCFIIYNRDDNLYI